MVRSLWAYAAGLSTADWITVSMIFIQAVLAVMGGFAGQLGKSMYWSGAVMLTIGVLIMKG